MSEFLLFALLGLGGGALFAGLALGIVLTFRGSGVVNLGIGAQAMLAGYVYYGLRTGGYLFLPPLPFVAHHLSLGGPWSTVPAFALAVAVCALIGALIDGLIFRQVRTASPLAKVVASLGILLGLQALVTIRFGINAVNAPTVLSESPVKVFTVPVPVDRFILTAIVVGITVVLAVVYRYTHFGIATRAAQENEEEAMLTGLAPARLSMINTVLASVLAAVLGIFVAPIAQLDPNIIALSVIPAMIAALIAGFTSFPIAAFAGLGVGIMQSLVIWLETKSWFPSTSTGPLPGVSDLLFFIITVVVLSVRGRSLPGRGVIAEKRLPAVPPAGRLALPAAGICIAAVIAVVAFPFDYRQALITSIIGAMMCLSFVVLTGFVGQVSLLQAALAGVTALLVSKLANGAGIGFPLGPLIGMAAALLVGVAAALSALRIRGVSLTIATLAAAVAVQNFWFGNLSFGIDVGNAGVPSPSLFGLKLGPNAAFFGSRSSPSPVFGYLCLAVLVIAVISVVVVRRSELGRRMLAVRSNERAAEAAGISVRETKLAAYMIASLIAGAAGALYAYNSGSIDPTQFAVPVVLSVIAFAYIGGITSVTGALIGGLGIAGGLITQLTNGLFGLSVNYQVLIGALALIVTVIKYPEGIAGTFGQHRGIVLGAVRRVRLLRGRSA